MLGVALTDAQRIKLSKAYTTNSDFSTRLTNSALTGPYMLALNKVQAKHLEKNRLAGKGMVIHLTSTQVQQSNKGTPKAKVSGVKVGGAINPALVLGLAKSLIPVIVPFIQPYLKDLEYVLSNIPQARVHNIYTNRIPNLNYKYDKLGNKIEFLKRKQDPPLDKINRIEYERANIEALIKKLITQLPILREAAERKNKVLLERETAKMEKEAAATEAKLNKLVSDLESLTAEKPAEKPAAEGSGLQVESVYAPSYRGNGLQIQPTGAGLAMCQYCHHSPRKSRAKKV